MTDRPFTPQTLAAHFEVEETMIYRAIRAKKLRAFRLGGKLLRITHEDAEAWFRSRCTLSEDTPSDASKADGSSPGARDTAGAVIASLYPREQASPRLAKLSKAG